MGYTPKKPDERLNYFMKTLSVTNRTPDYYVNWEKVTCETAEIQVLLRAPKI